MVDNIDHINVDSVNLGPERSPSDTTPAGLTAAEVAARLGVKRQTVYAYVSRGLLPRRVAPDGRTSLFDPADVDRLAVGRGRDDGEVQTVITTALTKVDDHTLKIRGQDLIGAVGRGLSFTEAVDLLWGVGDGTESEGWPRARRDLGGDGDDGGNDPTDVLPTDGAGLDDELLDRLRIVTALASASDPLRHELSAAGVRATGRRLITRLAWGLGPPRRPAIEGVEDRALAQAVWRRLGPASAGPGGGEAGSRALDRVLDAERIRIRAVDAALALLIDHGLAGSTFAARIAASVRADPYAVVGAGLGALGGVLHGAASANVHDLLIEAEVRGDTDAALGQARRRLGYLPGTGHRIYRTQDPRYGALMALLVSAWGDDPRLVSVYRLRDLIAERTDAIPNVDLALGALTYLARMPNRAGEALFAVARTGGWLAHAMEEYEEKPLRFRARARYTGP